MCYTKETFAAPFLRPLTRPTGESPARERRFALFGVFVPTQLAPNQVLMPITARRNAAGHLEVGGCDLVALAKTHGTPLYVLDEATVPGVAE